MWHISFTMLELSRQRAAPKLPVLPKLRFRRLKLPRGPVLPRSGIPAAGPQLPLPPGARDRVPEPPRGEPPPPPPLSLSYLPDQHPVVGSIQLLSRLLLQEVTSRTSAIVSGKCKMEPKL